VRSKADLFLAVSQRNALRRASGLPLLDMRAEMRAEHDRDLLHAYDAACHRHWSVYEQMKLDVLAEFSEQMPGFWRERRRALGHRGNRREEVSLVLGDERSRDAARPPSRALRGGLNQHLTGMAAQSRVGRCRFCAAYGPVLAHGPK
jgi:hypothetical protein